MCCCVCVCVPRPHFFYLLVAFFLFVLVTVLFLHESSLMINGWVPACVRYYYINIARARWIWHFRRCVHDQFEFQLMEIISNFGIFVWFHQQWTVASLIDHDREFFFPSPQHGMMCLLQSIVPFFNFIRKRTITRQIEIGDAFHVTMWPMAIESQAIDNFTSLPILLIVSCVGSNLSSSKTKHEDKSSRKLVT